MTPKSNVTQVMVPMLWYGHTQLLTPTNHALAVHGEEVITDEADEDGLPPHTLEMRSDQNIPLNEW